MSRSALREKWINLFNDFDGDVLFYFSGHGMPLSATAGYLVAEDGTICMIRASQ